MEKEFTLKSELVRDDVDRQMVYLVRRFTDLSDEDMGILLEMAHSLPFVGNLESGDTYINVLTRNGESMVVAQYRHPDCDLYKRSIIGDIEKKEDEPAVYRALEKGISGRGLIGIIDDGRLLVRHTVSPILSKDGRVIGSLAYEYPNAAMDTEPIRIKNKEGETRLFRNQLSKAASCLQDALLFYDKEGICVCQHQGGGAVSGGWLFDAFGGTECNRSAADGCQQGRNPGTERGDQKRGGDRRTHLGSNA